MHKFHSLPPSIALGTVAMTLAASMASMALATSMALVAEPAQARGRQAEISGSNGHSATRNVQRAGGDVSSTTTGPNGNARNRNSTRDGEGNGTTTIARANGEPATREVVRSVP